MEKSTPKSRVLSGTRPSGRIHLGNLEGALRNYVRLQQEYDCFYFIADWHALTDGYADTSTLQDDILEVTIDYLAAGIDPERSTLFVQSHLPEHAILHLLLSMIVPLPWLERVPTFKEKTDNLQPGSSPGYGLLGYPVLQAADILIYHADFVPVGQDQLPHLELTREIARRFNSLYGDVLTEPQALLTPTPLVPGIDNRKMSKSYGNHICLADDDATVRAKVMRMFTDPKKIYRGDKGHPDNCPVYFFHTLYNAENAPVVHSTCSEGSRGCVECKKEMADHLLESLGPIRAQRRLWEGQKDEVREILRQGAEKARAVAQVTLASVRQAMNL
jgi:tryptophanyl-tRNA synthetase